MTRYAKNLGVHDPFGPPATHTILLLTSSVHLQFFSLVFLTKVSYGQKSAQNTWCKKQTCFNQFPSNVSET